MHLWKGTEAAWISDPLDSGIHNKNPIDMTTGLNRLRGNRVLYKKLLLQLCVESEGVADAIEKDLTKGKTTDACRLVHQLKGTAGNLSATHLQKTALELETAIRNEEPLKTCRGLLEKIDAALRALRNMLDQMD